MKILCLDNDSNGLDLLMRAQWAGHECMWFDQKRKNGTERRAGEGIVPKLRDFEELRKKWLGWSDLIWFPQNSCYVEMIEPYRDMGYPVWGANIEAARWELDRAEGQRVMKEAGLNIIPGKEFHDHKSASAFVRGAGKPFVSKPSGEADKALSYVAESAADLVHMLDRWAQNDKYVADAKEFGFILQEKKIGCEMGIGGWFGPAGWAPVWEESFEYKKLMDGDVGENTGEQGTLIRFVKESKLADVALKPLTKYLKSIGYCGCVNVSGCIDEDGEFWPFEFTIRDGWPACHNHMALSDGDPAQWMLDWINGKWTRKLRVNECSISVVMSMHRRKDEDVTGIPIYGVSDTKAIHLCEVMLGESPVQVDDKVVTMPCYQLAGSYPLVVTGTGETITGARRSAYAALNKIKIPESPVYRLDIGKSKLVDNLPKIQRHGYARNLSY